VCNKHKTKSLSPSLDLQKLRQLCNYNNNQGKSKSIFFSRLVWNLHSFWDFKENKNKKKIAPPKLLSIFLTFLCSCVFFVRKFCVCNKHKTKTQSPSLDSQKLRSASYAVITTIRGNQRVFSFLSSDLESSFILGFARRRKTRRKLQLQSFDPFSSRFCSCVLFI
jgi:hypothetical protein